MVQDKQVKKVKQYRVAKTIFYCLGFPLFFVAVFLSAFRFIGNDPFTGTADVTTQLGMFKSIEILFTSPALYGVWIAFGIWMFIAIVHIILSKTVKNRRVRMFSVVALCLVVMLGGMFIMDAVLASKVDTIIKNAPEGVVVSDYKTQLSYYRTISSEINSSKDLTVSLIDKVELLEKVYNVDMLGRDKSGVSGNISNKPVTYSNVISDDGIEGVDIGFVTDEATGMPKLDCNTADGNKMNGDGDEKNDDQVITLAPDASGQLVINGKVYSHYFYAKRTSVTGPDVYVWYTKDMMPTCWSWDPKSGEDKIVPADGIYGKGLYNQNGLISDGWVYTLYNVLDILEDYYEADGVIANGDENGTGDQYKNYYRTMYSNALRARDEYYNGIIADADGNEVDAWTKVLYNQEVDMEGRFSLTRGELDELISVLGGLLGDNSLFDYLLINIDTFVGDVGVGGIVESFLGSALGALFKQLNAGMNLRDILNIVKKFASTLDVDSVVNTVINALGLQDSGVQDIYITAAYKAKDSFGREQDHLYIAIVKDNGEGGIGMDPATDIIAEINLDDEPGAMDLDAISAFLNDLVNNLISGFKSIINTVGGLVFKDIDVNGTTYKGLIISGIEIPLMLDGNLAIDLGYIVSNLLEGMYSYQSAVIKPVWEFYELGLQYDVRNTDVSNELKLNAAKMYAQRERANYAAVVHGGLMGSALLGDNLGDGTYPSSFGLNDLQSVRQLKTDLSYQREFFPIYALRDMLASFTAIVILFYFLSFMAAQKEEDYASGKILPREKKSKKDKKKDEEAASDAANEDISTLFGASANEAGVSGNENGADLFTPAVNGDAAISEDTALPVSQNPDKEVR